jgi:SNF2 family DNA or RNA helicase
MRFKKTPKYWTSTSNKPLEWGYKHYVFHYEQLQRAIDFFKLHRNKYKKPFMIVDESHNLNESGSLRTNLWLELCKVTDCQNVLPMSGTPLKAIGNEAIPMLTAIDSYFNEDAQSRFKEIFGKNASRAVDILRNRIGLITYKIDNVVDNQRKEPVRNVQMPNGEQYTLDNVKDVMRKFITERMAYYKENFKTFERLYYHALDIFARTLRGGVEQNEFKKYQGYISQIRRGYDPKTMKDMVVFCNKYEKSRIAPTLPKDVKVAFLDARSVIKYLDLKVQGEALGRILGRMRSQCHVDMVPYIGMPELIDASASKTLIFTSYVNVVKLTDEYLRKEGYQPLLVYGETNKDLKSIIQRFDEDEDLNPLIATFDSLSTAVPVISASTEILINAPFRDYEYKQATARVDRIGQKFPVTIWNIFLDTGGRPNISTRSNDILNWSREMVDSIMGNNTAGSLDLALEAFQDEIKDDDGNHVDVDGFIAQPNWAQWAAF